MAAAVAHDPHHAHRQAAAQQHWEDDELSRSAHRHKRALSVSSSNALENFGCFEEVVKSKRVVVLLDYDGTLTPIVNDPGASPSHPPTSSPLLHRPPTHPPLLPSSTHLPKQTLSSSHPPTHPPFPLNTHKTAQAHLPNRTRDILVELAERCVVGIVSGRSLPKVQGFVQVSIHPPTHPPNPSSQ